MAKQKSKAQRKEESKEFTVQLVHYNVHQKLTLQRFSISWTIPDFSKLLCNTIYYQEYKSIDINCVFRLFQKEDLLYVSVSGLNHSTITDGEFALVIDYRNEPVCADAKKIGENVFVGEFDRKQIISRDFCYLHDGVLNVLFVYGIVFHDIYKENSLGHCELLGHLDDLCCDLKRMYLDAVYPDFLIRVHDYSFKTHRFVLAVRSKYFEGLFSNDSTAKAFSLEGALPGTVHEVLLYIYSGELKELDMFCMLKVYELGNFLGVNALCDRCIKYFKDQIGESNYIDITGLSRKIDSSELKNIVIHYLRKNLPPRANLVEAYNNVVDRALRTEASKNPQISGEVV